MLKVLTDGGASSKQGKNLMHPEVKQRLVASKVLPEFEAALLSLVEMDSPTKSAARAKAHELLARIYGSLGGTNTEAIEVFVQAWHTLMSALVRLDHLQDGDAMELPLPSDASVGAQYNLIVGYYTLAWALLDGLGTDIPPQCVQRIRTLWGNLMLRAFSGQQSDLLPTGSPTAVTDLDRYQEIVQAKAGTFYALAFGGVATLATEDKTTINVLLQVGEIFGMLEQFSDDITDAGEQSSEYTLPKMYRLAKPSTEESPDQLIQYWQHVRQAYLHHVQQIVAPLPFNTQDVVRDIFRTAFAK